MTVKDFGTLLEKRRERYLGERERIALLSALDTAALMKRRVINERLAADGGIFGIYNEKYQKARIKKNLTGEQVNFSYTNKMWNSTTARIISVTDKEIVVLISPDKLNIEKMIHNTERFGPILELNEKEAKIHRDIYEQKVKDIF